MRLTTPNAARLYVEVERDAGDNYVNESVIEIYARSGL